MKSIFIYGSCVTRDIFRVLNINADFCFYSRSSLISLMSEPLYINPDNVQLTSEFQKRTVIEDFQKTFFANFNSKHPDVLIIDLIDERFDLVKYGKSYITRSLYFVNSKVEELYPFEYVKRFQEHTHSLWEDACKKFINQLTLHLPEEKIVLHEAYWATEYFDNGEPKSLPKNEYIKLNNSILKRYYSFMKSLLPGMKVVSKEPIADSKHIWGLAPFHYTDEYYHEIYNQLVELKCI